MATTIDPRIKCSCCSASSVPLVVFRKTVVCKPCKADLVDAQRALAGEG